jgi:glycosyltransferase involved in cell wall biosynthesis
VAHIGSLVKSRNPEVLWRVLQDLTRTQPRFASDLEIKLVGKVDFFVSEAIEKAGLAGFVKKIDYLPHDEVIEEQMKSQVLLLLINNTPNAGMILTGKFFEYMATRRPILCIGPENGDAADIIRETNCGFNSGFDDDETLKNNVLKLYSDYEKGAAKLSSNNIEHYSRKRLTLKLSQTLNAVSGNTIDF